MSRTPEWPFGAGRGHVCSFWSCPSACLVMNIGNPRIQITCPRPPLVGVPSDTTVTGYASRRVCKCVILGIESIVTTYRVTSEPLGSLRVSNRTSRSDSFRSGVSSSDRAASPLNRGSSGPNTEFSGNGQCAQLRFPASRRKPGLGEPLCFGPKRHRLLRLDFPEDDSPVFARECRGIAGSGRCHRLENV